MASEQRNSYDSGVILGPLLCGRQALEDYRWFCVFWFLLMVYSSDKGKLSFGNRLILYVESNLYTRVFLRFSSYTVQTARSSLLCLYVFLWSCCRPFPPKLEFCCSFAASVYLIIELLRKRKLERWQFIAFLGIVIGFFVMLAAPGNYVRLSVVEGMGLRSSFSGKWWPLSVSLPDLRISTILVGQLHAWLQS